MMNRLSVKLVENIFSGLLADFVGGRSGFLKFVSCTEGFPGSSAGKESACNVGDPGSIPGLGRSPGEGEGYPLQYSGLEIPWTV